MSVLSSVSAFVLNHGYLGIFAATALEYACFPISSEILFPFIGYCASKGGLSIFVSVFVSTSGAALGCSFCYALGRFGEKFLRLTLFKKFSKLKTAIECASEKFQDKGSLSVLWGRCFPLIRTYISFPAGISKMNYMKFIFYTVCGASVWNFFLISLGFFLGEHWQNAGQIMGKIPFKAVLIFLFVFFILRKLMKKRR